MLYAFKYKPYRKSLYDAFLVNICSLILGLVLLTPFLKLANSIGSGEKSDNLPVLLGLFYIQTVITEGIVLRLLHKTFLARKLIAVCLLMNLVTYILLYFIMRMID